MRELGVLASTCQAAGPALKTCFGYSSVLRVAVKMHHPKLSQTDTKYVTLGFFLLRYVNVWVHVVHASTGTPRTEQ